MGNPPLAWRSITKFWLVVPVESPPAIAQINCGGRRPEWAPPLAFHCTHPRVSGNCVYGPALSQADQAGENTVGVAAGHTTSLHELVTLMSLTVDPRVAQRQGS